jgi:hypothetical protein
LIDVDQSMTCEHCGDVIGIYEPLVLLFDGRARTSSAAAEPQIGEGPGGRFHRACYPESIAAINAHAVSDGGRCAQAARRT